MAQLGDVQFNRAHPRLPRPGPRAVAVVLPPVGALVSVSPDLLGDLEVHHKVGQQVDAVAQQIAVHPVDEVA